MSNSKNVLLHVDCCIMSHPIERVSLSSYVGLVVKRTTSLSQNIITEHDRVASLHFPKRHFSNTTIVLLDILVALYFVAGFVLVLAQS